AVRSRRGGGVPLAAPAGALRLACGSGGGAGGPAAGRRRAGGEAPPHPRGAPREAPRGPAPRCRAGLRPRAVPAQPRRPGHPPDRRGPRRAAGVLTVARDPAGTRPVASFEQLLAAREIVI